jgi:hypothetical protein
MIDNTYFAKLPVEEIGSTLIEKIEGYYAYLLSTGVSKLWKNSHDQFYEAKYSFGELYRSGDHGEFLNMPANHYKSLLSHIKVLTTNQRPALKPRAVNTDTKSTAACKLAASLLDYYMREQKVEVALKSAVDIGLKYGEGYTAVTWDMHLGEDYGVNPDTNAVMKAGDLRVKTYLPHFVVRDYYNMSASDNLWYILVDFVNKYELAAKYPEMEEEILAMCIDETFFNTIGTYLKAGYNESEIIPLYTFVHKRSAAMPDGRETILVDDNIILSDGPLPYKYCPIYRLAPEEQDFNQFGYTVAFDILAIQEAVTALYSCVATNQSTFAVQSILIPRGFNISVDSLTGGLNLIEYDPGMGKPEPISLTMTAPEVFNFIKQLEQLMQILVGISDVNRGLVPPNIKSGNALALLASQAIEFNSGLQSSYVQLLEDVGSAIIYTLKDYAQTPRIATISGKYNQSYLEEFKGEDLQLVNRVQVDVANPLTKTLAGKVQLADSMVERGWIKNPQQYDMVMETGNLDYADEADIKELYQMRSENEIMMSGGKPIAIITDSHLQHIQEHKAVLASPESRKDPMIVKSVTEHLMEHINLLRTGDPVLLQMLGQQPVAPAKPSGPQQPPQQPQRGPGQPPPQAADIAPAGNMATDMAATINNPRMPTNPLSGQEFNNETGGL